MSTKQFCDYCGAKMLGEQKMPLHKTGMFVYNKPDVDVSVSVRPKDGDIDLCADCAINAVRSLFDPAREAVPK